MPGRLRPCVHRHSPRLTRPARPASTCCPQKRAAGEALGRTARRRRRHRQGRGAGTGGARGAVRARHRHAMEPRAHSAPAVGCAGRGAGLALPLQAHPCVRAVAQELAGPALGRSPCPGWPTSRGSRPSSPIAIPLLRNRQPRLQPSQGSRSCVHARTCPGRLAHIFSSA